MYTYDLFVYGHDISNEEKLINLFSSNDISFFKEMNGRLYELMSHYHGGAYIIPYTLGITITDSDGDNDFVTTIRKANEDDYKKDYMTFISLLLKYLDENIGQDNTTLIEFKNFISKTHPKFYAVQVSS